FCPAIRSGLTLLTSRILIGSRSARSRTTFRQMSKLPITSSTRAPCITLCESLPRATRVCRRGRRRVAGGGADYRARALAQRLRNRQRHAPVLERAGRIGAFE